MAHAITALRFTQSVLYALCAHAPSESISPGIDAECSSAPVTSVGGQAVMEGIMMRNGACYALALRRADGSIVVERRHWYSLTSDTLLKKPFIRGFPILVETLINGIKALNRSAEVAAPEEESNPGEMQLALTLLLSLCLAIALFVAVPHMLALGMKFLGLGGDVERLSFHLWDGVFKFAIFLGYIAAISLLPDIRRVFQYHGAEHKVIRAFEECDGPVSASTAVRYSRLHPRCGTTFLLFVLSVAIVLHAVLVPLFLWFWQPQSEVAKHVGTLLFKILLMVPISAAAYEIIRYAAKLGPTIWGRALRAPGLLLQLLTTREPDQEHLEVALVALAEALEPDEAARLQPPAYTVLE